MVSSLEFFPPMNMYFSRDNVMSKEKMGKFLNFCFEKRIIAANIFRVNTVLADASGNMSEILNNFDAFFLCKLDFLLKKADGFSY